MYTAFLCFYLLWLAYICFLWLHLVAIKDTAYLFWFPQPNYIHDDLASLCHLRYPYIYLFNFDFTLVFIHLFVFVLVYAIEINHSFFSVLCFHQVPWLLRRHNHKYWIVIFTVLLSYNLLILSLEYNILRGHISFLILYSRHLNFCYYCYSYYYWFLSLH